MEQHTVGIKTFMDRYGVDPFAVSKRLALELAGLLHDPEF